MTVDALMGLTVEFGDGRDARLRAAIEQYGREQGFESTAQRDVREACYELRDALGNPVISGTGDQTIQGQTIRMAAARLRGSGAPVALDTEPANRVPNQEPTHQRERTDTMTPTDEKPMTVDALEAIAREVGKVERRHCIGKAKGFDVRDAYFELRAAIVQYGREQAYGDAYQGARQDLLMWKRRALAAEQRGSGEPVPLASVYRRLIRDDFERRMRAAGHGTVAMSRLDGGEYMLPAVHKEWESEKRKYTAPQPRAPLTDEQIIGCFQNDEDDGSDEAAIRIGRAIIAKYERAHNIRSEG